MKIYTARDLERIPQLATLGPATLREMQIVAKVLPFRVNNYVIEQLIDWSAVPGDPIFRLVFPNRKMLDEQSFAQMVRVTERTTSFGEEQRAAAAIRDRLNPHPADQLSLNRPFFEGERITGLQYKYPQTVLFFPSSGQTCHSFSTFCFRWPQFVRDNDLRIAMSDRDLLTRYLAAHSRSLTSCSPGATH